MKKGKKEKRKREKGNEKQKERKKKITWCLPALARQRESGKMVLRSLPPGKYPSRPQLLKPEL